MGTYDFSEIRRYGMKLGLVAGLMWIISFLMVAYTFPSLLSELGYGIGFASIWIVGMNVRAFRRQKTGANMLHCFYLAWMTFMCAMLLTTAMQYVYFAFLDQGHFFGHMNDYMNMAEVQEAFRQMQAEDMMNEMQESIDQIAALTARELTMSLMTMNMLMGIVFAGLATLFGIGAGKQLPNEM